MCLIEGARHPGTPVDYQRLAAGFSSDVPSPDVEGLVLLRAETGVIVEPAEEQRHGRIVLEGLHPSVKRLLQVLGRDVITAERLKIGGVFAHPLQRCPGLIEMDPFLRQDVGGFFRHAKYSDAGPVNMGGEGPDYLAACDKSMRFPGPRTLG